LQVLEQSSVFKNRALDPNLSRLQLQLGTTQQIN
jgi:hypothetical protein